MLEGPPRWELQSSGLVCANLIPLLLLGWTDMKPYVANLINAVVLIVLGLWGYLGSASPSPTALIPAGFGVVFLVLHNSLRRENKSAAHVVVVLTLLLAIALIMPIRGALGRNDTPAAVRVAVMLAGCVFAMAVYVRSFIEARRGR
jgi:hypothetical protein